MLTFTTLVHTDNPKGKTLKCTNKLQGDFTSTEVTQFNTEADSLEASLREGDSLWTVDMADVGFPPRGKRSEQ